MKILRLKPILRLISVIQNLLSKPKPIQAKQMLNQHITDYLKHYINPKTKPEHAVLINGKWGSGKTWFISHFIDEITSADKNFKVFQISLYGLNSLDDIASEYFRQAHPILSSQGLIVGKALGKALARGLLKIDLDGDHTPDAKVKLEDLDGVFTPKNLQTEKRLLIFDDVERCSIDIVELLGYINHFVEIQGYKAIILANEEKIVERWKKSNKDDQGTYNDIKEKLIGKTFAVTPDATSAINSFISDAKSEKIKDIYKNTSSDILSIYSDSKSNNLRQIKRTLWNFEMLIDRLPPEVTQNDDFNSHFFCLYLIYTIEAKSLQKGDLDDYSLVRLRMQPDGKDKSPTLKTLEKYTSCDAFSPLLSGNIWDNLILSDGPIDYEALIESILNTPYFYTESTPAWKQLLNFRKLDDEQFDSLKTKVQNQFLNCDIDAPQILLHMFGILLTIIKIGLLELSEDELVDLAKKNIDKLLNDDLLYTDEMLTPTWDYLDDHDSWDGLQYHSHNEKEFRHVVEYYKQQQEVGKQKFLRKESSGLIKIMTSDPHEFLLSVAHTNHGNSKFYDKPILLHIDPALFVETFAQLHNYQKSEIKSAISLRYKDIFAEKLILELDWLCKVQELMIGESKKWKGKASSIHFKLIIEKALKESIDTLKRHAKKKKKDKCQH